MKKTLSSLFLLVILVSSLFLQPAIPARALSFSAVINKSFNPIVVAAGEVSQLTISIYNPNSFQLDNASFTDSLVGVQPGMYIATPSNLTNTCGGVVLADAGTTTISLSGGNVPPQVGANPGSCSITVDVASTTTGNLINTIPAYGIAPSYGGVGLYATGRGGLDTITNNTPASATLQVNTVQPPSMNKNFSPNTVWAGQATQLEINLFNNDSTHALTQAAYTDNLPGSFVVASPLTTSLSGCGAATLIAAVGDTSITLSNATVNPGSTCRVRVQVVSPTQGQYTNTIPAGPAGVGSLQTQQGVTNNAPVTANVNVQAVGLAKSFSPASFSQGDISTLTITLSNPSGADFVGVGLVDTLPAGLTIVGSPASPQCGGTITSTANSITLADGVIPAGNFAAPGTCSIVAQVTSDTPGTYQNIIPANTLTGPFTNAFPATADVTVLPRTIGVVKAFSGNIVQGGTATLTITLQNTTSTTFTGVHFTDNLPANLTVVGTPTASASCGGGAVVASTGSSISLIAGQIPPGTVSAPGTCVITATVTSNVPGGYTNTIPVDGVQSDQGIGNNTAGSDTITVYSNTAPAVVGKAFQNGSIIAGVPNRLRITITAPNDTPLSAISINDTLPDDLVIVGTPLAPANPVTTCGGTLTAGVGTNLIQLMGGSIASAGGSCTITVYVISNIPGSHTNTIPANSLSTFEGRTDPNNRSATMTVTSLSASKTFAPGVISPNGLSRFTISLRNYSLLPLVNVSVTDLLTSMGGDALNGVFVAPTPNAATTCGAGTVTAAAGSQTISLGGGTIPASDGVVPGLCTISVDVRGIGASATRTNTLLASNVTGTVQGTGTTMHPTGNTTAALTIRPLAINVNKQFTPVTVFGGSSSVMSVDLVNPETVPLSGIQFTDVMPLGMILATPVNFNVGTCGGTLTGTPGTDTFSFSGGSLPASGSCTLKLDVTMTVINNLTNSIAAGAVTTFEGASNADKADATLSNLPGASVSKSFSPNPVPAGDYSLLTIRITNASNVAITGMGLNDDLSPTGTLPAGLSIAAYPPAPAPANACGGTLTAVAGSQLIKLDSGTLAGSSTCDIVVPVTSTVPNSYLNVIPAGALTDNEGVSNDQPASDTLVVTSFSLGNRVWEDNGAGGGTADNGIRDGSEPGMANRPVNLYLDHDANNTPDGASIAATVTDSNGYYRFDGLTADNYIVEVVPPAGYIHSTVIASNPNTDVDNDNNGVNLVGGNVLSNFVTLGPGAVEPTTDNDPATNPDTADGEPVNNQSNRTVDFGFYRPFSLGNRVWFDNGAGGGTADNGLRDGSEPGLANVIVNLYRDADDNGIPDGIAIAYTTTDANGYYSFNNLPANTYIVEVVSPSGYAIVPINGGDPDNDIDNDNNGVVSAGTNIRSNPVTLGPGALEPAGETDPATNPLAGEAPDDQSNRTVDFGFTTSYSLGNRVWFDNGAGGGTANNGLRDGTEPGIDGVTVNLYRSGTIVATTVTSGGGYYRFDHLPTANPYVVEVVVPAGYVPSAVSVGNPNAGVDNDNNGAFAYTVATVNYVSTGSIVLGPGLTPTGETDPAVNPLTGEAPDDHSDRTIDFGFYYQPYSLGNRVWNDNGAGGGTANNGLRDGTEPGLSGVAVRLYRDSDDNGTPDGSAIAVTTTDANGYYRFDYLQADTYIVETAIPAGYMVSVVNGGDPDNDIDDDNNGLVTAGSYIRSNPVTLGPGAAEPTTDNDPATNPLTGEAPNNYSNRTVDFAFTPLASLGDLVWNDLNQDGIQDSGEPGIPGVKVDLYTGAGVFVTTTNTGGGGLYSLTNLTPGDYYVIFTAPAGYTISPKNASGNAATDSDADTTTGQTATTTLIPGENDLTWDAGMYQQPASIGNYVWNDLNRNGLQDDGTTGINGVRVDLYRPGYGPDGVPFTSDDANIVATTTTANISGMDGTYLFTGLIPGDYYVKFTPLANYALSPQDQGGDDTIDSDASLTTGQTVTTALSPGENDLTWDAGMYELAAIGDYTWNDLNRDGIQDSGEPALGGVTVNLYTSGGTLVASTITTGTGYYHFTGLVPGDYYIIFGALPNYGFSPQYQGGVAADSNANPATGQTGVVTLAAGDDNLTVDAGLYELANLGDRVWNDLNRDGIQEAGEPGMDGVTVDLYTSGGTLVATTTTTTVLGVAGTYRFNGLVPGDYYVVFSLPSGYVFSPASQGSDDALDSDANPASGQTTTITLAAGQTDLTWDAGLYLQPASLGNYVWNDVNANGIQDGTEPGIDGVTVNLYRPGYGADGISGNADDSLPAGTTTTAGGGLYGFANLTPGYYYVSFTPPAGYVFTLLNQGGNTALDSDVIPSTGNTVLTQLTPGENDLTWDAGLYQSAAIGDRVWVDTNANGLQDTGETGIDGVTVNLYRPGFGPDGIAGNADDADIVATQPTAGGGLYHFTGLMPGDYFVDFVLPSGYSFSPQDQGADDTIDSDADLTTGQTVLTTLSPGEDDLTWDAGLYQTTALGDRVWLDTNANGVQDAGETGIDGVTVNLYRPGFGPDGIAGNADDNAIVATQLTAGGGLYGFANLIPSDYVIEFMPPSGYALSPQNQGADDAADSDADLTTGRTASISLPSGVADLTWDAGLYLPAAIGDRLWLDTNANGLQDTGETGYDGVTVNLYRPGFGPDGIAGNADDSAIVATQLTAGGGLYHFTGLIPGDYYVEFVRPSGYLFSPQDQGADDTIDSDADLTTGQTAVTTLVSGEDDLTWDAGLYLAASLGNYVWLDSNLNGIQDTGETGVAAVTVHLYRPGFGSDGIAGTADDDAIVATQATVSGGLYTFTDLIPGSYFVEFVLPPNYTFSAQDQGGNDALDSDANPSTGRTVLTTLVSGENDMSWDAGLNPLASLGDYVWNDTNDNGIQDAGELGIDGVTVNLYTSTGTLVAATTTAGGGFYAFTSLNPGDYYIEFVPPSGYIFSIPNQGGNDALDSDANPVTGVTSVTTLIAGENDTTWDAGLNNQQAALGNFVWNDINNDGIQDAGEPGVANVLVSLYTNGGAPTGTTLTDSSGYYGFTGLTPGGYYVVFSLPSGYVFSPADQGSDDALDSDANPASGQTTTITLAAGQTDITWDAGLNLLAKIGVAKQVVGTPILASPGTWDVTYQILVQNYGTVDLLNVQIVDNLAATFPSPTAFTVQALTSSTLAVNWPGYNGDTNTNLLAGTDTLPVGGSATLNFVVRVVPAVAGPFNNSAFASGQDSYGNTATDQSDDGVTPDGDGNGDPSNDKDPTPVSFGPDIFDPPYGIKIFDDAGLPLIRWSMVWINNTNIVSINALVNDPIPEGLTFSAAGAPSGYPVPSGAPAGSSDLGVLCEPDPTSTTTTTTLCYYEGPTTAYPRGRIIWQGVLGPDLGATDAASAHNEIVITFNSTVDSGANLVNNVAEINVDRNGNGNTTDTGEQNVASASANWVAAASHSRSNKTTSTAAALPNTGFAPGRVTPLPVQPDGLAYTQYNNLSIEIPALNVKTAITGVPFANKNWDVTWLGKDTGWLEGTAFPGWEGNSVLTGHVYTADGLPGPFANLGKLKWGDKIIVHVFGQKYTYQVRSQQLVSPTSMAVLGHKTEPWLTLITCNEYSDVLKAYRWRVAVQAVLISVENE